MNRINQGFESCLFHPSVGNEVVEGRILVSRSGIRFESEVIDIEIPADRLRVEWEDAGERIHFKDPGQPELTLYTTDESILDCGELAALGNLRLQVIRTATRKEISRRVRLIAYFGLGCVLVWWMGSMVTGCMVRSLAARVPAQWEKNFGEESIREIRDEQILVQDSNKVAQLAELAAPLLRVVPLEGVEPRFYLMNDPEPNAFALPGGHIVVTLGLLQMVDSQEELLGVLAHELAHVTQKHYAQQIIAGAGPVVIFGVFLHSKNGFMNALSAGSGFLVYQSFSRNYETEADDIGWDYLVKAHIDPRGMISMFEKFKAYEAEEEDGLPESEALSSHPALDKRIARLEKKWKRLGHSSEFLELTNAIPKPEPDEMGESLSELLRRMKKKQ